MLLLMCGALLTGPQALLQLGAWSWMLTSYAQQSSWQQAISETFGGDRPCRLCVMIQSTASSQQMPDEGLNSRHKRDFKLILLSSAMLHSVPRLSLRAAYWQNDTVCQQVIMDVPPPPPKFA